MKNQKIVMYGAMWCPDTLRTISFFNNHKLEFEFKDIDSNEENTKFVEETNNGMRIIPTIVFANGTILSEPSNAELERTIEKLHEN
jgi:glutaredoxin